MFPFTLMKRTMVQTRTFCQVPCSLVGTYFGHRFWTPIFGFAYFGHQTNRRFYLIRTPIFAHHSQVAMGQKSRTMGQNPNRTPSEHPNPTAKSGSKMGGEFTNPNQTGTTKKVLRPIFGFTCLGHPTAGFFCLIWPPIFGPVRSPLGLRAPACARASWAPASKEPRSTQRQKQEKGPSLRRFFLPPLFFFTFCSLGPPVLRGYQLVPTLLRTSILASTRGSGPT